MNAEIIWIVLSGLLIVVGLVGSLMPALPGSWLGLVGLGIWFFIPPTHPKFTMVFMGMAMLLVVVNLLMYLVPIKTTQKFGGSRYGVWGSIIGMVAGVMFTPIGMILGAALGAFIGELINDSSDVNKAFKAAIGSLLGFFISITMDFILGLCFLGIYIGLLVYHF